MNGYVRVCAAVPQLALADVETNVERIVALWRSANEQFSSIVVFPELSLCGYTLRDLFFDRHLESQCLLGVKRLREASRDFDALAVVGVPLRFEARLFNTAIVFHRGRILGVVPKTYIPNYGEFEEKRWFASGADLLAETTIRLFDEDVPFGNDLLFRAATCRDVAFGVEICEDMWVPIPPNTYQILGGATVICNLSASNFLLGKAEQRRSLVRAMSQRGCCGYVFVAAGPGESSTDLAFDADAFVCERGNILIESKRFSREAQCLVTDIDVQSLQHARLKLDTFHDCMHLHRRPLRTVLFEINARLTMPLRRTIEPHPFLPKRAEDLSRRCWEVFEIQCNALLTRMKAIGCRDLVLGLSGGLDSTHAALVASATLDHLNVPRTQLHVVTMPGLGTTETTLQSARGVANALGANLREISIVEMSRIVLESIGHPASEGVDSVETLIRRLQSHPELGDITVENVQARLRTLILMSLANHSHGLLLGTGDLSEKALGWATYGGDQIAMYDVNAGVPKTLIRFVIEWVARDVAPHWSKGNAVALRAELERILQTPISPELLPADRHGQIQQLTETTIGPYELHDFFLFHLVLEGRSPTELLLLARYAFGDRYSPTILRRWLELFLQRFFANQFKRSCTADAPKVGPVGLSPRGDWRMPSDAQWRSWIDELRDLDLNTLVGIG